MPGSDQSIPPFPPPPINLTRYTEAARRQLYAVVALFFLESSADPEEWVPPYSPDDAGLTVFQALSRWFVTWEAIEERDNPDLPPYRKQELMAAYPDPEARFGACRSMSADRRIARQVGAALRRIREERGTRQSMVADLAGITRGMLSAYETGRQCP